MAQAKVRLVKIMANRFLILWHGVDEFEPFDGTLDEAIESVKADRRYMNYGRKGASIISFETLYQITEEGKEIL
jgi:hypothetical protein